MHSLKIGNCIRGFRMASGSVAWFVADSCIRFSYLVVLECAIRRWLSYLPAPFLTNMHTKVGSTWMDQTCKARVWVVCGHFGPWSLQCLVTLVLRSIRQNIVFVYATRMVLTVRPLSHIPGCEAGWSRMAVLAPSGIIPWTPYRSQLDVWRLHRRKKINV